MAKGIPTILRGISSLGLEVALAQLYIKGQVEKQRYAGLFMISRSLRKWNLKKIGMFCSELKHLSFPVDLVRLRMQFRFSAVSFWTK
jgi:hypothetical protein